MDYQRFKEYLQSEIGSILHRRVQFQEDTPSMRGANDSHTSLCHSFIQHIVAGDFETKEQIQECADILFKSMDWGEPYGIPYLPALEAFTHWVGNSRVQETWKQVHEDLASWPNS